MWYTATGPWTGLGTSLGLGPLYASPMITPQICALGSDGLGMRKQEMSSPPTLAPGSLLRGAGGVLLMTQAEDRCQISDKVIFTLEVEGGR